jgi:pimeloyl-ACP methyl ester carboxylesterase
MSCVFLFLLVVGASQSSGNQEVRAALERRYAELASATERRDLAAYLAVRHETFHTVSPDGRISGPIDMNEYSKQFFAGILPPIAVKFTIRSLSVSADGVIASADVFQELSRFREFEGQRQRFETTVVQRETWIKTRDGWKLKLVDNVRDQTRRITLARRSGLPLEVLPGVEVVYTAIRNPKGPLQRAILTRPGQSTSRLPAILFVPWLSCDSVESPNGAAPGIDQFLHRIAAETPFVLLRVDKPGVGDSEGVCGETDLETEIDGSRTALTFLTTHPWVDASRIAIIGHSFSGAFLPLVAGDTPVAGYVVISSWVRSWFERLIEFERLRLERSGMAPGEVTDRVAAYIELYTGFLLEKKTPAQVIKEKPFLARVWDDQPAHQYGRPAVLFHQLQAINASRAWSGVRVPTLAIWGEADIVMHRIDHERLVALVNANAPGSARLLTVPGMDHTMRVMGADGRAQLPESAFRAVTEFLSATLGRG